MSRTNIKGTITALATPFNSDLSIDYVAFERFINYQIDRGIEGILICGSTGEAATMSAKEKITLINKAVEIADGRVSIIAGTGSNDTRASIEFSNLVKDSGAAALLIVAPYYNKPTQEGLYQHYLAISEAVDMPQIIYNVPGRSGININAETQLRIAENCENIIATKEASGNLEQMATIMKYAPEGFSLYSGDDALGLPAISLGAIGVISVISNYAPKEFGDCVRFALSDNFAEARKIYFNLLDLMGLNFVESNPTPAKAALSYLGLMENVLRLPLIPITEANGNKLKDAMAKAGLIQ